MSTNNDLHNFLYIMSVDPKLFTNYVNENINRASELAKSNSNPEISDVHLIAAMLESQQGFQYLVLQKSVLDV